MFGVVYSEGCGSRFFYARGVVSLPFYMSVKAALACELLRACWTFEGVVMLCFHVPVQYLFVCVCFRAIMTALARSMGCGFMSIKVCLGCVVVVADSAPIVGEDQRRHTRFKDLPHGNA